MLSVAMIVKNEAEILENAIRSIGGVDEIVVVDTGSTDGTVELAKKLGVRVFVKEWNDDFSEARNYALDHCNGDWILIMDADYDLEEGGIERIKKELEDMGDHDCLSLKTTWANGSFHRQILVLNPKQRYTGKIHEYVMGNPKETEIVMHYSSSPSHKLDPDRNLRILKSEVKNGGAREMYYLAHEYFDRANYIEALKWYKRYIKKGTWREEIADANLRIARCLWILQKGDEARNYCLQAILGNPNFKEALLLMAEMSWEEQAVVWRRFAETANNNKVLFIRSVY